MSLLILFPVKIKKVFMYKSIYSKMGKMSVQIIIIILL